MNAFSFTQDKKSSFDDCGASHSGPHSDEEGKHLYDGQVDNLRASSSGDGSSEVHLDDDDEAESIDVEELASMRDQ